MTIWILLLAVVVGLIAGVVRRGDFPTILGTRIYHPEFLASSIVCAFVVSTTDVDSDGVIAFVALVGAFAFALMNLHLVGMVVILIGLALNLFVFILNLETPVRPNALVEAEIITAQELEKGVSISGHVELADSDTVLEILGDTFPIRLGERVVSIGDLIFLVGLANVTGNLMLGNQRRRHTYGQFWQTDESVETELEGEEAEIPIELDLETPEPASVYAEQTSVYPEQTSVYADPATDYSDSGTAYPQSESDYSDHPTVYPQSESGDSESATVYSESYDEYSESPTVYPQSAPTAPQPQQPEDPEDPQDPEDPWSVPPWNPTT